MRILERYVLKNILGLFFTCLLTFLFLYIIIDVFSHLEEILRQQVHIKILIQYYLSYLPIIFVQVAPFSSLLAVLYTFGKLNRDNEIIVMRASGLSIFQITKDVIIFGFIVSLLIFWLNERFVPQSMALTQNIKDEIESGTKRQAKKDQEEINNFSMYGSKNRLFFVSKFTPGKNIMEGITILEHDEHQNIIKKIVANKGLYENGMWKFYQCITYNFDDNSQILDEPSYMEEEIMNISESPREFLRQRQRPEFMTIEQLNDYREKLMKSGAVGVIRKLEIDLYQRYTSCLTTLIIILLAIPFSLMMKKRATGLSSLGLSIMMGFLYYVANAISIALGYAGFFSPILAVSFSHIAVLIFSVNLIKSLP